MGSRGIKHQFINTKKNDIHFTPGKFESIQRLRPGPAPPFSGKWPSSCVLWRGVAGRQPPGQCWNLSNHRTKGGMWVSALFGLAQGP